MNEELKAAIELSIEVWKELAISGDDKCSISTELWNKIKGMKCQCPLCSVFHMAIFGMDETECINVCPLKGCTIGKFRFWDKWDDCMKAGDIRGAKHYAQKIVDKLEEALK